MSFGDKTKKIEDDPVSGLDIVVAINIHATGEGVAKIDWMDWFLRARDEDIDFTVTHADIKYYYTEKKDK